MNYQNWITHAQDTLKASGIETARLDAMMLLEYATSTERAHIMAHPETMINNQAIENLELLLARRVTHEPMAYIVGSREFYGRTFSINSSVLVPRPESEDIITLLLGLPRPDTIIDVGTGSGILAITAALEIPTAKVFATDNDPNCINIARQNAANLGAHVVYKDLDLITNITKDDINDAVILANLPYVPLEYPINADAAHEPETALYSPEHGLGHYRRLFSQLHNKEAHPLAIICESLTPQHFELARLAESYGFALQQTLHLQQLYAPAVAIPKQNDKY